MVATISPLVKAATAQWAMSTMVFMVAMVGASSSLGLVLGFMGQLVMTNVQGLSVIQLVVAAAIIAGLLEAGLIRLRTPSLKRGVPQHWWIRFGPTWGAILYGAVLGLGFTTFVPVVTFYFILLASFLLGPASGVLVGAAYGFGRGVPVLLAGLAIARGMPPTTVGRWVLMRPRPFAKGACLVGLIGVVISALL